MIQNLLKKIAEKLFPKKQGALISEMPAYEYISSGTPYENKNFTIVSNNCWGAEIYKKAEMPFNTPFIGLYLYAEDYLRLLKDFENVMRFPLRFTKNSRWLTKTPTYPVGILGDDIEIHFLHYKTEEEALDKWTRRTERLLSEKNHKNFFFRMCDRDGATMEMLEEFHGLPFQNKISFGVKKIPDQNSHIQIRESDSGTVPDGVLTFNLTNKYVDLPHWINSGNIKKNKF